MISPTLETEFWAAVEDCLVRFHQFSEAEAKQKVRDLWRRLAQLQPSVPENVSRQETQRFDDMIYHAEPWYIACNLAGADIPLEPNRTAYEQILKDHLA